MKCWNATEAARRAEYKWPRRIGTRLLDKFQGEIQERINELVMSADESLVRMSEIARGVWAEYIQADSSVDMAALVRDGKAHLIKAIKPTKYGSTIEFCDMQKAIEMIGRAHQIYVSRTELTGADGGPVEMETREAMPDFSKLTDDELEAYITICERLRSG